MLSSDKSNMNKSQNTYSLLSMANMALAWSEDSEAMGARCPSLCQLISNSRHQRTSHDSRKGHTDRWALVSLEFRTYPMIKIFQKLEQAPQHTFRCFHCQDWISLCPDYCTGISIGDLKQTQARFLTGGCRSPASHQLTRLQYLLCKDLPCWTRERSRCHLDHSPWSVGFVNDGHESIRGPDKQNLEEQVLLNERELPVEGNASSCDEWRSDGGNGIKDDVQLQRPRCLSGSSKKGHDNGEGELCL